MTTIEEALTERGIEFKTNPNNKQELLMRCFSGIHSDKSPSLSYNTEKGLFNCFACDFRGDTAKFLKELNITVSEEPLSKQGFKIKKLLDKLSNLHKDQPLHLPEPRFPIKHAFKGISAEVLQSFDAFTTTHDYMDDYVCIPVYQNKKLRFIEGRNTALTGNTEMPKYMRKPAGVDVKTILFPLDRIKDYTKVILVEGIFDMINMHALGYTNTLCIFGINNFNAGKAKILDELGCRKVVILMDGDAPGARAAAKIKTLFDQLSIYTEVIELADGKDPGILTQEEADAILGENNLDNHV